ncbi:MAG: filamentous hemagglutinin family protein [Rhizobacter sp.]|nr:filamentous hemagglutinin family protein [Rhizobacter sp.]
MKNKRPARARPASPVRSEAWHQSSCSLLVLASLGLISFALPHDALAQRVIAPGTLPVLRGVVANSGNAIITSSVPGAARSQLTIDQTTQRAIINWRSFDIGSDAEVLFRHHTGAAASTLNRIFDANPSLIQGVLRSEGATAGSRGGQIILINQNGIVFGRGAQVNTSLVASTLNLSNERFLSGALSSGGLTSPAFEGGYNPDPDLANGTTVQIPLGGQRTGDVVINGPDANGLGAPILQANPGGSIMIFAPRIDNQGGIIQAPDGQVILAAGSKAYLSINPDENDITLRGYVVEVEASPDGPGLNLTSLIRNSGNITADRGNVTLAALAVNQEGRVSATTALQANGSIYLKAHTKDQALSGAVSFKAGSVTEVTPDAADTTTAPDSQAYLPNRGVIDVTGRTIENHGTVRVPGGLIKLTASSLTEPDNARVYLGAGSETSVAGAWADVDFGKNLQTFRVTSNELKNSPDQKTGVLRGAVVTVDLRQDNNILELTGYRGLVARTVAEKAAVGGELNISSTGSVIQRSGAVIDASGGGYRYNGGTVNTSRLLGSDGKLYDIASAPEQLRYMQLLDNYQRVDTRWGQTTNIANPLGTVGSYQAGYSEGKAGGLVTITSKAGLVLDGTLKGGVTVGARQMANAPRGATLQIGQVESAATNKLSESQRIGNITWQQQATDTLGAGFYSDTQLTAAQRDSFTLGSSQVFGATVQTENGRTETGFGTVELNSNGRIVLPSDVSINSDSGASLVLRSRQTDIAGDIRLASGNLLVASVSAEGASISPDLTAPNMERVIVRSGAELSTAGAWINNANADGSFVGTPTPSGRRNADGSTTRAIDGGSITLSVASGLDQTRLESGSVLDVGGGASIASNQRVTGGNGGKLSIANGGDNQVNPDWLQADLRGFAIGNGAELSLKMARATIVADGATGVVPQATTRLEAGLFADHGFSKVNVETVNGIDIAAGTAIKVEQKNLVIDSAAARQLATGGDLSAISSVQRLPDSQRAAASVELNAKGGGLAGAGVLNLNQGASITTDPRGAITLSGTDGLNINGHLSAPGGRIGLTLNGPAVLTAADLHIGATADISVAGTFVPTPNERGLVQGTLLQGGAITVDAKRAGLQIDEGARLDVSGLTQTVDVVTGGRTPAITQQTLEGHAGSLTLKSQGATVIDGTLLGHGGSPAAAGGSFALELMQPDGQPVRPLERRIVVTPAGQSVEAVEGLVDAKVNVAALTEGGFDKLRLLSENRIEFQGSSNLSFERGVRLDAPLIDLANGAQVRIEGASAALGQSLAARENVPVNDNPSYVIKDGTATPVIATRAGTGELSVQAGAVDLYGSLTINGTQRTRIESDSDIRLVGRAITAGNAAQQIGGLTSAGNIELVASQVYPATRTQYNFAVKDVVTGDNPSSTLTAGGRIDITGNGHTPGRAYSAGGTLSFEADTIRQAGTVKAPNGEINLLAGSSLELAAGSHTSVSGDGLTVLYGNAIVAAQNGFPSTQLTDKQITLSAPSVTQQAGATVDLRGGGDILGVEFVAGNGGDKDITLAANTYAIIPAANLAAMPYDLDTLAVKDPGFGLSLTNGRDGALYDSIRIGAGGAVPAGEYVLLPARYALLADAYLVELQTGAAYRNLAPGQNTALLNGQVVLAGHRSARGTDIQESQSVGVVVRPGAAAVRRASDYNLTGASVLADAAALDRKAAPPAPWDAGRLLIENVSSLALNGDFETAAATSPARAPGRIAEIDISAQRIAVVDRVGNTTVPTDFLQIEGAALSNLGGNVLLGGKRSSTDNGVRITSLADSQVVVANSSAGAISLPELTLAASDSIDIRAGSVLAATGTVGTGSPEVITTGPSGALVRLSSGAQTRIDRGSAVADSGDVRIAEGASLSASQSMLIDATRSTESRGTLRAGAAQGAGGSLSLSSVQVNLGDTAQATGPLTGLVLSNTDLAAYRGLDELVLRGYGAIDLIGSTTLGSADLKSLMLDTPLLHGRASGNGQAAQATITAKTVELANNSGATRSAAFGQGNLDVQAERLVLGAGSKAVDGFATVRLAATDTLVSEGKGAFNAAANLTLQSPRVLAAGGSNQTVSAADSSVAGAPVHATLTLAGSTVPAPPVAAGETELGGRLTLQGSSVNIATTVQARSGQISVQALGSGAGDGVVLASGALLDARGQAKDFNGTVVTADGGSVALSATTGPLAVQTGAKVDVSAATQGGAAGRVALRGSSLALNGELVGRAATGARSGSAELDLGSLAGTSFSALNSGLNAGGFAEERQLRLRSGDIAVASGDHVDARRVTLTADTGRIDVAGSVGTGAAQGGAQVNLFADTGITLAEGSRIVANGSNAGARGGEVRVATRNGTLAFATGAEIDVRAGEAGPAGSVIFGVSRDGNNVMGATSLQGTVRRGTGSNQASVDVEATRVYDVAGSVDIDTLGSDHAAFVAAADTAAVVGTLRDETGAISGARVLGATEVRSQGNLLLDTAWDLTNANWLAEGKPGTLTVRAAGNLTVSQALGSPDNNILAGDTWSLRLAAGADLASANPLAALRPEQLPADSGSLLLTGANAKLRTGTGRIDLTAARDIRINNVAATIYTAGRIGARDTEANGNNRWAVDGGGISMHAGGSVVGAMNATGTSAGDLWINEWLRRPRTSQTILNNGQQTDWWSYRPRFQQAVGTLAGGDVDVVSGGNVQNLDAMLPTSGRTYRDGDGVRHVDVQGGGNLNVRAGENIAGGSFLVSRGEGRVEAAGDVGVDRRTQLYVMGASSGAVPEGAGIDVVAGGAIALQSVFNPTAMVMRGRESGDPATGPSFGANSTVPYFLTYTSNSWAGAQSKSGDVSYGFGADGGQWRPISPSASSSLASQLQGYKGVLPPNLALVALDGDIVGSETPGAITTMPSASASVSLLASQSLRNVGLHVSDLDPALVSTSTNFIFRSSVIDGLALQANRDAARIVERNHDRPFAFEIQALAGSFLASPGDAVYLPAVGRVRAGVDIVNANLVLQNLHENDVTEVRADSGDFRALATLDMRGPGRLLLQAGRNIDLGTGSVLATGSAGNTNLSTDQSARITLVAGVNGDINLPRMDAAYAEIVALNKASADIIDLYRQLGTETDAARVLAAGSIAALAQRDPVYARFVALDQSAPRALNAYQAALRTQALPLGPGADGTAAVNLYRLLNTEADVAKLSAAGSLAALAAAPGGSAYSAYVALEQRYPRLFADYVQRRSEGAIPIGVTPIVFSDALAQVIAEVARPEHVTGGNISSFQTSIQTNGGSDIDLWAPGGNIVVGLTSLPAGRTVGVLTTAGGAIRGVSSGDFNINVGKVLTAQGGDILLFSTQGSIDAGRGAKTSLTTPPPVRTVVTDEAGNQTVKVTISSSAAGSGIQTLSSDPDGLGPLATPKAGDVFLFAPAGAIDAGEAGIRSSGNIVLNAQTVLNGSNISSSGSSQGVPVVATGSLASSLATSGSTSDSGSKAAQDAAKNAAEAARAATATGVQKPSILTVEVLGFGEKNCKEQEKDCFAK